MDYALQDLLPWLFIRPQGGSEAGWLPNFRGVVLGCMDSYDSEKRRILQFFFQNLQDVHTVLFSATWLRCNILLHGSILKSSEKNAFKMLLFFPWNLRTRHFFSTKFIFICSVNFDKICQNFAKMFFFLVFRVSSTLSQKTPFWSLHIGIYMYMFFYM